MFWKPSRSALTQIDDLLEEENVTLEELLDEDDIIKECRALNLHLINFLRDRTQVEQLLRYIVEEAPEEADNDRAYKFPCIACEIFTCEIDVIFNTLVEEEELMDLLFSFLEPNRPHSTVLAGYFSKVASCLLLRKTVPVMKYVKTHQGVFGQLVDLIGLTSIMEVLIRIVEPEGYNYPDYIAVMEWLADNNLLEMIVDRLSPHDPPFVNANAAETLRAIIRTAPSPLVTKLSSPSFVSRLFGHALEDAQSKSALVNSLSVLISLLDPTRSISISQMYPIQFPSINETPEPNSDIVHAMLPKLGDLVVILSVSADAKVLPTTFGELMPPLGKHRLKIVEFISVLLQSGNNAAEEELISSGAIWRTLDLLFEYPYNNELHHNVETIIYSCLQSKNAAVVNHILKDCNLVGKIIQADKHPSLSGDFNQPTIPASGKKVHMPGYLGHLTRIANKIVHLENRNEFILAHTQENSEWNDWRTNVLQELNAVEDVNNWECGRPTVDVKDAHDRDNGAYGNDDTEEDEEDWDQDEEGEEAWGSDEEEGEEARGPDEEGEEALGPHEEGEEAWGSDEEEGEEARGPDEEGEEAWDQGAEGGEAWDPADENVYYDNGEVVIKPPSLEDYGRDLFTDPNWFAAFERDIMDDFMNMSTSRYRPFVMGGINVISTLKSGSSRSPDEVEAFQDEGLPESSGERIPECEEGGTSGDLGFFSADGPDTADLFGYGLTPELVVCGEASDSQAGGSCINPFADPMDTDGAIPSDTSTGEVLPNVTPTPQLVACGEASDLQAGGSITNPFVDHMDTDEAIPSDTSIGEVIANVPPTSVSSSNSAASELQAAPEPTLFEVEIKVEGVGLEGTEKSMQALEVGIIGEAGSEMPRKENPEERGPGMNE